MTDRFAKELAMWPIITIFAPANSVDRCLRPGYGCRQLANLNNY